jgi:hypothetical protein
MKKLWGTLAALTLLTGCAATPAPAPVDTDAAFLTAWHTNFPRSNDEDAKSVAHDVCDAYRAGTSFTGELQYIMALAPQLTPRQAGGIIGASTAAYCPEFNNRH